jgi:hypothetical protein
MLQICYIYIHQVKEIYPSRSSCSVGLQFCNTTSKNRTCMSVAIQQHMSLVISHLDTKAPSLSSFSLMNPQRKTSQGLMSTAMRPRSSHINGNQDTDWKQHLTQGSHVGSPRQCMLCVVWCHSAKTNGCLSANHLQQFYAMNSDSISVLGNMQICSMKTFLLQNQTILLKLLSKTVDNFVSSLPCSTMSIKNLCCN